jgi:toxin ParE1/3/4
MRILEHFPRAGRVPRYRRLAGKGLGVLIIESYLAFYKIRGATVEIHRVIHGARDYEHLI